MKKFALAASLLACGVAALAQAPVGANPMKLDTNHDGFISRDEASADPGLARRFDRIDSNHDGKLSADELKAFRAQREERMQRREGERGIAKLDANKDGFISRDEAKGRPELLKRFDEIDTDHDQRLSREELRAARRQHRDKAG